MAPPRKQFPLGHGKANAERREAARRAGIARTLPYGVKQPKANSQWHPMAQSWYRALGISDLALVAQPSDWMLAYVAAEVLDRLYTFGFSAGLFKEWNALISRLHVPGLDLLEDFSAEAEEAADEDEEAAEAAVVDIRRNLKVVD